MSVASSWAWPMAALDFLTNEVETSGVFGSWGPNGERMTVWDKLIAGADGQVIQEMPF